jgi:hypothetical protein
MTNLIDRADEIVADEKVMKKELIRQREIRQINLAIESMNFTTKRDRIAGILNLYPETRDSDMRLTIKYWETYQSDVYSKSADVSVTNLFKLERLTTVARLRAKIQNEFGLFLGSESVRHKRRLKEEQLREEIIEDSAPPPWIHIFADETGKTSENLIIGSVWFLDLRRSATFQNLVNQYKHEKGFKGEFHFTELKASQLDVYKGFVDLVKQNREYISIKSVATKRRHSSRSIEDTLKYLHQFLIEKGFDSEVEQGRVSLPRYLNLSIDKGGMDSMAKEMLLRDISQTLEHNYGSHNKLNKIMEIDSKDSAAIQLSDLITGSLNRLLNGPSQNNHKDEFSGYLLKELGVNLDGGDSYQMISI